MTSDPIQPMTNPVELLPPARRPLSISQLQLWYRCGYAWHLRYALGHSPRVGAGAWFGRMMHEVIVQMYRGCGWSRRTQRSGYASVAPSGMTSSA